MRGSRGREEPLRGPCAAASGFLSPINPRINRSLSRRLFPGSIRAHLNTITASALPAPRGSTPPMNGGAASAQRARGSAAAQPGRNCLYRGKRAKDLRNASCFPSYVLYIDLWCVSILCVSKIIYTSILLLFIIITFVILILI